MAKIVDENGYRTYLDIPITTEGVYDYAGFQIDQTGKLRLEKKKIYKVFRPKEELLNEAFVKSLEEMPLTDDHTPLGDGKGLLPAEKNTHGVLFNIRVNDSKNGLIGDIKVFSETLKKKIDGGKREVSLGYTCRYKPEMGMYEGQSYDFVQFDLCCNHCAIVDTARMGHACRVSDSATVTCDSLELPTMPDDKKSCADELIEKLKGCSDEDLAKVKDFLGCGSKPEEDKKTDPEEKKDDKPVEDEKPEDKKEDEKPSDKPEDKGAEDEVKPEEKSVEDEKKDDEDEKKAACDAAAKSAIAEYQKALALAEKCKPYFGTIAMDGIFTEKDVALKVCAMDSALKNVSAEGAIAALTGFLAGKSKEDTTKFRAGDSAVKSAFNFAAAFKARK